MNTKVLVQNAKKIRHDVNDILINLQNIVNSLATKVVSLTAEVERLREYEQKYNALKNSRESKSTTDSESFEPGDVALLLSQQGFPDKKVIVTEIFFDDGTSVGVRYSDGSQGKVRTSRLKKCLKPNPGKGYRLLSKLPLEDLQAEDEYLDASGQWRVLKNLFFQSIGTWYRRKISDKSTADVKPNENKEPEVKSNSETDLTGYRKPTDADIGKMVEVNGHACGWMPRKFLGKKGHYFRCESYTPGGTYDWSEARIKDPEYHWVYFC
jgi:hypothetical protein